MANKISLCGCFIKGLVIFNMLTFRRHYIFLCLLIFNTCLFSVYSKQETAAQYSSEKNTLLLFSIMQDLLPLVLDEQQFNDIKNKDIIGNNLDKLNNLFVELKEHSDIAPITFNISSSVLSRHIKAAKKAFANSEYVYARYLLKSLPAACISYYNRDEYLHKKLPTINKSLFVSEFDLAEFYYMFRNYKQALVTYETFINKNINQANKGNVAQNIQTSLERILAIYLHGYKNPGLAFDVLQNYQKKFIFPEYINIYITEWLKGLELVEDTFGKSVKIKKVLTFNELKKYISEYFHESETLPSSFIIPKSDQMFYLMLSGYLNDYLYTNPKKEEIPALLYWSSLCDRALNYHDNISVADLYLKECVVTNPKSAYAKKCLSEYDEYMTLSYSGIDGDLPHYISKEIKFLHDLVYID